MRGKAVRCAVRKSCRRITPAYAGKSLPSLPPAGTAEDHPRLCGEKFSFLVPPFWAVGSPPPMRGKVPFIFPVVGVVRITPAYAGKSVFLLYPALIAEDHPRLCGEKQQIALEPADMTGSPPPMRGKVPRLSQRRRPLRITPAYAGKRHFYAKKYTKMRDHPRLCGEKQSRMHQKLLLRGSPPPMRGKVSQCI